jgi:HTH-type transcriptional regulator / antitoxin HipB
MHPINTPKQVGATLTGRRNHLKLSQTDVASRLGLSQNRLSELENRPETLTVEQLLALLNVLGLEMTIAAPAAVKPKVGW